MSAKRKYPDNPAPRICISIAQPVMNDLQAIASSRRKWGNNTSVSATARTLICIGMRIWAIGQRYGIKTRKDLDELMERLDAVAAAMQAEREATKAAKKKKPAAKKPPAILLLTGISDDYGG